jgi:hypothetical protein
VALASLQQLPIDILGALATVRGAAATAAKTLCCHQCASVLLDTSIPLKQSFRNTLLLGNILESTVNAHSRLLNMIDVETEEAVATYLTKFF